MDIQVTSTRIRIKTSFITIIGDVDYLYWHVRWDNTIDGSSLCGLNAAGVNACQAGFNKAVAIAKFGFKNYVAKGGFK